MSDEPSAPVSDADGERTFVCENCGVVYNTYGRYCPLRSCYECGERNPWTLQENE